MSEPGIEQRIQAVRAFNRFYTQRIGVLHEGYLKSPFSLAEARVLWELAHRDGLAASDRVQDLGLDPGYLSRILKSFEKRGLLARTRGALDRRSSALALTRKGRAAFAPLDAHSRAQIAGLLKRLDEPAQAALIRAMQTIQQTLAKQTPAAKSGYLLRLHEPGDMGWVLQEHGILYAREYGWNAELKCWSPRWWPASWSDSIPNASAAGSPSRTASASVPSSWCVARPRSVSCGC